MIEFRDALTDLIEEFGTEDGGFQVEIIKIIFVTELRFSGGVARGSSLQG